MPATNDPESVIDGPDPPADDGEAGQSARSRWGVIDAFRARSPCPRCRRGAHPPDRARGIGRDGRRRRRSRHSRPADHGRPRHGGAGPGRHGQCRLHPDLHRDEPRRPRPDGPAHAGVDHRPGRRQLRRRQPGLRAGRRLAGRRRGVSCRSRTRHEPGAAGDRHGPARPRHGLPLLVHLEPQPRPDRHRRQRGVRGHGADPCLPSQRRRQHPAVADLPADQTVEGDTIGGWVAAYAGLSATDAEDGVGPDPHLQPGGQGRSCRWARPPSPARSPTAAAGARATRSTSPWSTRPPRHRCRRRPGGHDR